MQLAVQVKRPRSKALSHNQNALRFEKSHKTSSLPTVYWRYWYSRQMPVSCPRWGTIQRILFQLKATQHRWFAPFRDMNMLNMFLKMSGFENVSDLPGPTRTLSLKFTPWNFMKLRTGLSPALEALLAREVRMVRHSLGDHRSQGESR